MGIGDKLGVSLAWAALVLVPSLLWASGVPSPTQPAPAGVRAVVGLRAEATVPGPEIRLGEIADITGTDAALIARLRELEVGRAPLPGLTRPLDLAYLKSRLRAQQVDLASLRLDGGAQTVVAAASQRILGEELVAVVREQVLQQRTGDTGEVVVRVPVVPADLVLPVGQLELKTRGRLGNETLGTVSVAVEAWVDGQLIRTVSLPVRIAVQAEVVVAARSIGRHTVLTREDLRLERRELVLGQDPLRTLDVALGQRAVRAIHPGEPLLSALLERPPLVRRGDVVILTAEGRGVRAAVSGEAREDGKAGQVIRVRSLSSGREVYGQVEGEGRVRVAF